MCVQIKLPCKISISGVTFQVLVCRVGVDYNRNRNRLQLERNRNCNRNQIFQIVV